MIGIAAASSRHRLVRVVARLALPLLVATVTFVVALQYPASSVPGGVSVGPRGLADVKPVTLDFHPTLAWGSGHRFVVLRIRAKRPCSVVLASVTSTAPGRIDVRTSEHGRGCSGRVGVERFLLPLPVVPDPRGTVRVDIEQQVLRLRAGVVRPHPSGVLDP